MKSLQIIKSLNGRDEYVLLPMSIYRLLHNEIDTKVSELKNEKNNTIPFILEDYVDNPIAIARIKERMTQEELAMKLGVSQAYISKLEAQSRVSPKTLRKVLECINDR